MMQQAPIMTKCPFDKPIPIPRDVIEAINSLGTTADDAATILKEFINELRTHSSNN
jgi:hypothetical protein